MGDEISMRKRWAIYMILTIVLIIISIEILHYTNLSDNVALSKSIQIILILFLIRVSIGCSFYIKKQYEEKNILME